MAINSLLWRKESNVSFNAALKKEKEDRMQKIMQRNYACGISAGLGRFSCVSPGAPMLIGCAKGAIFKSARHISAFTVLIM